MKLSEFLNKKDVRITDLAKDSGCTPVMIHYIRSGTRRPSPDLALAISNATGGDVSIMELLFPNGYPTTTATKNQPIESEAP